MAMYGYIRTSRDQEPDRAGMNPETQRRDLLGAGVLERNIHADIDVSGVAGVATRNAWRSVDANLEHGDVLVVAALDRIGRRSLDVMGKIYDLVNRGVRLRSLADNEAWAKGLDADPESMEWMTAMLIAQVCSFSAQLERQAIARRTRAGLARARAEGKRLGRPLSLDRRADYSNPSGSRRQYDGRGHRQEIRYPQNYAPGQPRKGQCTTGIGWHLTVGPFPWL